MNFKFKGSVEEFDKNWNSAREGKLEYWTKKKPINQTQYSFRMLWGLFKEIIKQNQIKGKDVIEIGSGRGTLSSYFADHGYNCHLLDSSKAATNIAKKIFKKNNHKGTFINNILENFKSDKEFDIVFSIGLLEHFKDVKNPLIQQIKILKKNGLFMAYVVPDYNNKNVQKDYTFLVNILKAIFTHEQKKNPKKEVYRNSYNSKTYLKILKPFLKNISAFGVYPLPMISYSKSFPFTVLDQKVEYVILNEFDKILKKRISEKKYFHPWLCKEGYGQAFLIWGKKK